jgi:hypothetical protein
VSVTRRIVFLDSVPDALGRRHFRLEWEETDGIFRTEKHPDGHPVGYRRAQEFHCRPEQYMEGASA